ncbi:MAG: 3-phosphoshikimate 1-carboxyvinyltransferase [Acidobacteria bacterium]|nr:3-phosphoshikimate 1-carboxyvinyltransferase [Acidobacteriota bacterium]
MKIRPAKRVRGHVASLPGDKSVSHRAALIAALARGRTVISNYATSADCASTLACLAQLGVSIESDGSTVTIEGAGMETGVPAFRVPAQALDCGNSGSTMRMLAGVLAAQGFTSTLMGDASLGRRPMRRIIEPLELMGARISSEQGHAPLRVEGRSPLDAIEYETPIASAQVKSCVLLAGLGAEGRTRVVESARTAARDLSVPGDISSAAFLVCAAALLPGSELEIGGVGLNPTRAQVLDTLAMLGADVRAERERELCNEPIGDIRVRGIKRSLEPLDRGKPPFVLRGHVIAGLIDELPVLAVVGTQVEGGLEIREARELRVKESDRISATVENLRAMGAEVEEFDDGLKVYGRTTLRGAKLDAHGDHRVAMAFTVAALIAEGETEIAGAEECVGVSFPEFFPLLESLTER